ncbi:MAG: septum formation initiator family protein [Elusimicrobiaceae bacterium]|nr:septum formation initiator family protein [Elusimicrobiaceae bacterium]
MTKKKLTSRQKLLIWGSLGILLAILWLGGGLVNLAHNKLEIYRLTKKRERLDMQYQELLNTKKLLEDKDPQYMEELARLRYNLVKPGEIEFRFTPDD